MRWQYTKDGSGSSGSDCLWVDHVRWQAQTLYNQAQLQEALDTDLDVYTIGSVWNMCDWPLYHIYYGDSSASSGWIGSNQKSQMEVRLEGPGTVTFYWKVSSLEDYHWLEVYLDGVLQDRISGEVNWHQKSYNISGSGTHSLMWQYSRDGRDPAGSDRGWVDYLQWTPSGGGGGSSTTDWEQITYTYDPTGRRIAKDVDGTVTKYVYDGDHCIAEYDGSDNLLRKYVHGQCIDEPICMIEVADANAAYFYHYDALGSVVALSDAAGDTVQVYEYDIYGQVAASDPNHTNPFLFTGRRFDPETGLYYYRARYYNASIGRFLQTDPIGYADGMNWYAYCNNSPAALADPSGMASGFGFRKVNISEGMEGRPVSFTLEFYWTDAAGNEHTTWFNSIMDWIHIMKSSQVLQDEVFGENGWQYTGELGWELSGNDTMTFWAIRAIMWLDESGTMAGIIGRIEAAGVVVGIGQSYYNAEDNIVCWDPTSYYLWPESEEGPSPFWPEWRNTHPLVNLAHEMQHAFTDIESGDPTAVDMLRTWPAWEVEAVITENIIRGALSNVDPSCSHLVPRPGYRTFYPDITWEMYNSAEWQEVFGVKY